MRRRVINSLWVPVLVVLTGCYDPLFPKDEPRTQYETYDKMRNQYKPLEENDVFGNPQPALRSRLANE